MSDRLMLLDGREGFKAAFCPARHTSVLDDSNPQQLFLIASDIGAKVRVVRVPEVVRGAYAVYVQD